VSVVALQADPPSWIPETYVLSQGSAKDQAAFKKAYERHAKAGSGTTWIVKPTSCNRGNGIEVFNKADRVLSHVNSRKPGAKSIVQKYIDAPLLVDGRKFDMRAYVLVTPAGEVFLHREAYVRTCGTPYVLDDLSNKAAHLTNDAVQKKTEGYGLHEDHCKLTLDELQAAVGSAADVHGAVRDQMVDCVRRLFGLVVPKFNPRRLSHCFELFGLDFMIDAKVTLRCAVLRCCTALCSALICAVLCCACPSQAAQADLALCCAVLCCAVLPTGERGPD
jgi:hypothetical protein